eukprot:sb/3476526/
MQRIVGCWFGLVWLDCTSHCAPKAPGSSGTVVSVCRRCHCLEHSSLSVGRRPNSLRYRHNSLCSLAPGSSGTVVSVCRRCHCLEHSSLSVGRRPHSLRYRHNSVCSLVIGIRSPTK